MNLFRLRLNGYNNHSIGDECFRIQLKGNSALDYLTIHFQFFLLKYCFIKLFFKVNYLRSLLFLYYIEAIVSYNF
jgi:hypothetical protein